jgi:DNA-binding MarR family transcriptional regulator
MTYDFVNELGHLALATRLKRISEAIVHSSRQLYKTLYFDIEPNWHLIFKLLLKYNQLTVMEIATKLHFSHPSVIGMVNKMVDKDYLVSAPDENDARKRLYRLSEKALDNLPEFEKVWNASVISTQNLFKDDSFLDLLQSIEIQLSQKDFMNRTLSELSYE